jgi:hypothetical protein
MSKRREYDSVRTGRVTKWRVAFELTMVSEAAITPAKHRSWARLELETEAGRKVSEGRGLAEEDVMGERPQEEKRPSNCT